ncbi:MAG: hypothetical protein C5B53_04600 [Candidatus Melainabacteria bacterium]|nr:MAG: hypothetical protein C5B53_04600 [Candidatus Melainabacteria bacterium]
MYVKSKGPIIRVIVLAMFVLFASNQAEAGKPAKPLSASVEIAAPPEAVFEAIQKTRDSTLMHRKLLSYDGKVAKIKENLEDVPIYGKVECIWEETETPFERIEYKMLSSDKFKSGSGTWILTPSADHKSTNLELQSFLDTGLHVPFAGEITKMGAAKDNKVRLKRIKEVAEGLETKTETKHKGGSSEKK